MLDVSSKGADFLVVQFQREFSYWTLAVDLAVDELMS